MKIYTKKGDQGQTSLYGGTKVSKAHIKIDAYGTTDELNAVIGCILAEDFSKPLKNQLLKIQQDLFVAGAELATPNDKLFLANGKSRIGKMIREEDIVELENWIDAQQEVLPQLTHFILPGGGRAAALAHIARTVCRRAERIVVALKEHEEVRAELVKYLNRLSDYFFTLSRTLTMEVGGGEETKWIPEK